MKFNCQKKVHKANRLQWMGDNFDAVDAMLKTQGYDSNTIYRECIMARGKDKPLLTVHKGNWLRIGQNKVFKIMHPDDMADKYEDIP